MITSCLLLVSLTTARADSIDIIVLNSSAVAIENASFLEAVAAAIFLTEEGINDRVVAEIASRVSAKLAEREVAATVSPAGGAEYVATRAWAWDHERQRFDRAEVTPGRYHRVVVEVPHPSRVARQQKGAFTVFMSRLMLVNVRAVTMKTLAGEIAAGLAEGGVEALFQFGRDSNAPPPVD